MKRHYQPLMRLSLAIAAIVAAVVPSARAQNHDDDREMRTRDRQTYEVLVGDYYTGRSPYFKSGQPVPVLVAQATAAPAPKPALPCSVINSGLITMTETMPAEATLGEPFTYELRPLATGCAANVVVTDTIPDGTTLVSTDPQATVDGNKVTWNLGNLDSGESKTLRVTVKPEREGTLVSCATVKADPRICAQTVVGKPQLAIDKSGPEFAQLGSEVAYNIVVKNIGTAVAKGVVVTDKVPAGLGGPKEIPFTVGDLAPGASKTIPVRLNASERGRFCNVAVATASNTSSVQDDACTTVVKPGLKLEKTGLAEQYTRKQAPYKITARNIGDTDLHNVIVTDTAPPQTQVVSAPGGQISGNTITWNVGTLKAGETKDFAVTLTSRQVGKWCNSASVASQENLRDTAEFCTLWKGVPGVLLEVVDDPDPLQVGEETTYTVRITNQGDSDLINLNTVANFQKEISPETASEGTVDDKTVKFPAIPRLAPKQSHTYTIKAKAIEVGDHRLKVVLTEDQLLGPVNEEESTRVY
jgi:uncharacterized repeat protein (TIGR01451 family)